jgi:hypothetical protein
MTAIDSFFTRPWFFCRFKREKRSWRDQPALPSPKKKESVMPKNGFVLNGTNPLEQALAALDDTLAKQMRDLAREKEQMKDLFTSLAHVSEADRQAVERYDLSFITTIKSYGESSIDSLRFDASGSNYNSSGHMDWYGVPEHEKPRLKGGRYAVVIGLKRIGDL